MQQLCIGNWDQSSMSGHKVNILGLSASSRHKARRDNYRDSNIRDLVLAGSSDKIAGQMACRVISVGAQTT
jgi:hypothetical protein